MDSVWANRHPSVAHFEPLFAFEHLPQPLQDVSMEFALTAEKVLQLVPDGPELTAGLRKLLEAKDCVVRQMVLGLPAKEG